MKKICALAVVLSLLLFSGATLKTSPLLAQNASSKVSKILGEDLCAFLNDAGEVKISQKGKPDAPVLSGIVVNKIVDENAGNCLLSCFLTGGSKLKELNDGKESKTTLRLMDGRQMRGKVIDCNKDGIVLKGEWDTEAEWKGYTEHTTNRTRWIPASEPQNLKWNEICQVASPEWCYIFTSCPERIASSAPSSELQVKAIVSGSGELYKTSDQSVDASVSALDSANAAKILLKFNSVINDQIAQEKPRLEKNIRGVFRLPDNTTVYTNLAGVDFAKEKKVQVVVCPDSISLRDLTYLLAPTIQKVREGSETIDWDYVRKQEEEKKRKKRFPDPPKDGPGIKPPPEPPKDSPMPELKRKFPWPVCDPCPPFDGSLAPPPLVPVTPIRAKDDNTAYFEIKMQDALIPTTPPEDPKPPEIAAGNPVAPVVPVPPGLKPILPELPGGGVKIKPPPEPPKDSPLPKNSYVPKTPFTPEPKDPVPPMEPLDPNNPQKLTPPSHQLEDRWGSVTYDPSGSVFDEDITQIIPQVPISYLVDPSAGPAVGGWVHSSSPFLKQNQEPESTQSLSPLGPNTPKDLQTVEQACQKGLLEIVKISSKNDPLNCELTVKNLSPGNLEVVLPAFSFFISAAPTASQHMMKGRDPLIKLARGETRTFAIDTYCVSTKSIKPPPEKGAKYSAGRYPDAGVASMLPRIVYSAAKLDHQKKFEATPIAPALRSRKVAQTAIWLYLGEQSGKKDDLVNVESIKKDLLGGLENPKSLSKEKLDKVDQFARATFDAARQSLDLAKQMK